MATKTNLEILDEGMPDPPAEVTEESLKPSQAYGNALAVATWGKVASPTMWGTNTRRVGSTVTGASVSNEEHLAVLPGPVIHVEATAGSFTGPLVVMVVAAPASGQVRITTDGNGRDLLEFNAGDSITACAYRQLSMPQEVLDKLGEDTDPPIEA